MINIEPIKAFNDNYIWLVTTNEGSIVIDPGESTNLINFINKNNHKLEAIFITHHHFDHTGGIDSLITCLLYTSPSPRDRQKSRMPSSA